MSMEPTGGGPAYATGEPEQAPGGGGVCGSCGRELPPPDLEAVAASIDQTLSLEAGKMVPRTAWAGRPPDGAMDALLFWLPSVKANRKLWERGQALWTEQMTAALSGPCNDCLGAVPLPPGASGTTSMPEAQPAGQAPTAYMSYEPGQPAHVSPADMPATSYMPAHEEPAEATTSAVPAYSDYTAPPPAYGAPPAAPVEDAPTSAVPAFGGEGAAMRPVESAAAPPPSAVDEHESHTMILSSMPSVRTGTRLVVLEGPVRGRQFSLGRDRTTIGRSIGCHITVEADAVEYDHAAVARTASGWQIEVSRTAGQVDVNDEPVRGSRALTPGDVIRIGPARLRFESVS